MEKATRAVGKTSFLAYIRISYFVADVTVADWASMTR